MKYEDYMTGDEYMDQENLGACGEGCDGGEPTGQMHMPARKMIEVEEVLGMGSAETTTEVCIPLNPPAFEILDNLVSKEIIFDVLAASKGKVFVNGRIIKDIPYKTRTRVCRPSCSKISKATFGDIRHVTVEVPFALCIDVPEAFKGAKVVVLESNVESVEIPFHTPCVPRACISRCENPAFRNDPCERKLFCSITEKDCIFVRVKVVRDTIMTVPAHDAQF